MFWLCISSSVSFAGQFLTILIIFFIICLFSFLHLPQFANVFCPFSPILPIFPGSGGELVRPMEGSQMFPGPHFANTSALCNGGGVGGGIDLNARWVPRYQEGCYMSGTSKIGGGGLGAGERVRVAQGRLGRGIRFGQFAARFQGSTNLQHRSFMWTRSGEPPKFCLPLLIPYSKFDLPMLIHGTTGHLGTSRCSSKIWELKVSEGACLRGSSTDGVRMAMRMRGLQGDGTRSAARTSNKTLTGCCVCRPGPICMWRDVCSGCHMQELDPSTSALMPQGSYKPSHWHRRVHVPRI